MTLNQGPKIMKKKDDLVWNRIIVSAHGIALWLFFFSEEFFKRWDSQFYAEKKKTRAAEAKKKGRKEGRRGGRSEEENCFKVNRKKRAK